MESTSNGCASCCSSSPTASTTTSPPTEHVWPEMLDALSDAGWRNYSLFVRPDDGLVVGYLETDDFAAAQSRDGRHRGQRALAGRHGRLLPEPRRRSNPTRR